MSLLRKQVLRLYQAIIRHAYQCDSAEYKQYIRKEAHSQFATHSQLTDTCSIRERIYEGESRILTFQAYGDPYPKQVRDVQRVWRMGAGYSKRGKMHQQFSKRENKFNTHHLRNQKHQQLGLGKVRKLNRKPGEYDLPVFDTDNMHDVSSAVRYQIEKKTERNEKNTTSTSGTDRRDSNNS
mmetsp:Transcript_28971/g.47431  ORF Transcript_28971/g.47431 Transcript_28971/m.47431 type:complete len:181 (+) Transcript_28971:41-583(+)